MNDLKTTLRKELRDPEYSEGYAESFLNAYVATQIKVIREQRKMTQAELAEAIGTTQAGVSRIENVNYSSWGTRTLIKLARAFKVRLKVSFEPYGTLPDDAALFYRDALERVAREDDPGLWDAIPQESGRVRSGMYDSLVAVEQCPKNVVSISDNPKYVPESRRLEKEPASPKAPENDLLNTGNQTGGMHEALCGTAG